VRPGRSRQTKPRLTTRIEDLPTALRRHAKGMYCAQAAVELLIGHRLWLERDDFVTRFVDSTVGVNGKMAWVEWERGLNAADTGRLVCSSSEAQVLAIAASIAEGVPVDLRDALSGLDDHNLSLVAEAVAHAGGRRAVIEVTAW
jgi:hypothetical protein